MRKREGGRIDIEATHCLQRRPRLTYDGGEQRAIFGIPFSNHFGKRSFLDRRKIKEDFDEKITRWRATRQELLATTLGKPIFWNWGALSTSA